LSHKPHESANEPDISVIVSLIESQRTKYVVLGVD